VTELFEFLPDPECPVTIGRRITDEYIGQTHTLAPVRAGAVRPTASRTIVATKCST
jgi:hypothetical protein